MQVMSNGRVRRSAAEWRELLARWKKSGLSPRGFCRKEGIQPASFQRWQRKLEVVAERESFVPVISREAVAPSSWSLEILLPDGCRLHFRG